MNLTLATAKRLLQGLLLLALACFATPAQAQLNIYYAKANTTAIGLALTNGTLRNDNWITTASKPYRVAVVGNKVYWSTLGGASISYADLTAKTVTEDWLTDPGITDIAGIAFDSTYVYWADEHGGFIGRATLDLVTIEPHWITSVYQPFGVAVDAGHVYWANRQGNTNHDNLGDLGTGSIGRADIGGTNQDQSFISPTYAALPTDVAVNGSNIYWPNSDDTIASSLLDGTSIVAPQVSNCTNVNSLAVADKLYWGGTDNIGAVALTGVVTDPGIIITNAGAQFFGVAIAAAPTVVTVASFTATPGVGSVKVAWTTGSEVNTVGYNVWRGASAAGAYAKVNATLLPAQGTDLAGASYTWTDTAVTAGQTWFYQLEDLDTHGASTFHGPVSATVGAGSLLASFQATPPSIFLGGGSLLAWTVNGAPALTLNGADITGASLWVAPAATTSYTLADAQGDRILATVNVKAFSLEDMAGLSKAWGSVKGQAAYDPSYDLNGDGKVDDADVALCFKGL